MGREKEDYHNDEGAYDGDQQSDQAKAGHEHSRGNAVSEGGAGSVQPPDVCKHKHVREQTCPDGDEKFTDLNTHIKGEGEFLL